MLVRTTAIAQGEIPVLGLTEAEHVLVTTLPRKLGQAECQAIALCQQRHLPLLSNDRCAMQYCQTNGIDVVDLPTVLRLFWTRQVTTRTGVVAGSCLLLLLLWPVAAALREHSPRSWSAAAISSPLHCSCRVLPTLGLMRIVFAFGRKLD